MVSIHSMNFCGVSTLKEWIRPLNLIGPNKDLSSFEFVGFVSKSWEFALSAPPFLQVHCLWPEAEVY